VCKSLVNVEGGKKRKCLGDLVNWNEGRLNEGEKEEKRSRKEDVLGPLHPMQVEWSK